MNFIKTKKSKNIQFCIKIDNDDRILRKFYSGIINLTLTFILASQGGLRGPLAVVNFLYKSSSKDQVL